jgi:hypothetical protein
MNWFRMYSETLNDPKVQSLSGDEFKAWVNLLCLASQNNSEGFSEKTAAFALRLPEKKAWKIIKLFLHIGLLDITESGLKPHNWAIRQYKSDTSNDRVRRHRERAGNAAGNVTVTPPETDTDTDTERRSKKNTARGSRLPHGWTPDDSLFAWAANLRRDLSIENSVDSFRDYWTAQPGQRGVKLDWNATFRNWIRRESSNAKTGKRPAVDFDAQRKSDNDAILETLGLTNLAGKVGGGAVSRPDQDTGYDAGSLEGGSGGSAGKPKASGPESLRGGGGQTFSVLQSLRDAGRDASPDGDLQGQRIAPAIRLVAGGGGKSDEGLEMAKPAQTVRSDSGGGIGHETKAEAVTPRSDRDAGPRIAIEGPEKGAGGEIRPSQVCAARTTKNAL